MVASFFRMDSNEVVSWMEFSLSRIFCRVPRLPSVLGGFRFEMMCSAMVWIRVFLSCLCLLLMSLFNLLVSLIALSSHSR